MRISWTESHVGYPHCNLSPVLHPEGETGSERFIRFLADLMCERGGGWGGVLMTALSSVPLTRQNRGRRARCGSNLQLRAELAEFKLVRSARLLIAALLWGSAGAQWAQRSRSRARWKWAAKMKIATVVPASDSVSIICSPIGHYPNNLCLLCVTNTAAMECLVSLKGKWTIQPSCIWAQAGCTREGRLAHRRAPSEHIGIQFLAQGYLGKAPATGTPSNFSVHNQPSRPWRIIWSTISEISSYDWWLMEEEDRWSSSVGCALLGSVNVRAWRSGATTCTSRERRASSGNAGDVLLHRCRRSSLNQARLETFPPLPHTHTHSGSSAAESARLLRGAGMDAFGVTVVKAVAMTTFSLGADFFFFSRVAVGSQRQVNCLSSEKGGGKYEFPMV